MRKDDFAPRPPMGWNSWDCYGASVREEEVRANARYMAQYLKPYGWRLITVDIQWSEPMAAGTEYHDLAPLTMDAWGRLMPAVNRFPSADGGKGFAPLADYVHSLGLDFGIHIMRGIPRQAVHAGLPILHSPYTCRQAASGGDTCAWNHDMYGFHPTHPAAEAYVKSIIELYADWGVDFLKIDDLSAPEYHAHDVELYAGAIEACQRPMVFSASPGDTPLSAADHAVRYLNMWRVSNDFWDDWAALKHQYDLLSRWNPYMGPGHFPDGDMLPLGRLYVRTNHPDHPPRASRLTAQEQRFMMTLWSIAKSPLILGAELTLLDGDTLPLLTNPEILEPNQRQDSQPRPLYCRADTGAWISRNADGSAYLAHFNLSDTPRAVATLLTEAGLNGPCRVRDLWNRRDLPVADRFIVTELAPHDAAFVHLIP